MVEFLLVYIVWGVICFLWIEPQLHKWVERKTGVKLERRIGGVFAARDRIGLTREKFNAWLMSLVLEVILFGVPLACILYMLAKST